MSEAQLPLRAHPSSEISKGLVASGLNLALCRRHSVPEEVRNQLCHPSTSRLSMRATTRTFTKAHNTDPKMEHGTQKQVQQPRALELCTFHDLYRLGYGAKR